MTFATPWLAALAAGIAVPTLLILYFLKLRRRDVEVSTTLLWKKAIQDLQANAPFQKLRKNILLLLQMLALVLALLALAQPEFRGSGQGASKHILLIDRSASMSAADGKGEDGKPGTRLDEAKRRALEVIESLREPSVLESALNGGSGGGGDEAMVIAFDVSAVRIVNFTSSKRDLRAAVESITPTDSPSSLSRAMELAKAYKGQEKFEENKGFVPGGEPATLHLFSDGRLPDLGQITPNSEDTVLYYAVGQAAEEAAKSEGGNVGITGLRAQRSFENPDELQIFVGLQSTAHTPRSVDVELLIDGVVSNVKGVTVAAATPPPPSTEEPSGQSDPKSAEATWTPGLGGVVIPLSRRQAGVATVRISTSEGETQADELAADNEAHLVLPPARRLNVALVSRGSLFLRSALEAINLSSLKTLSPEQYQTALDEQKTGQYDVVIFDKWLPSVPTAGGEAVRGLPYGRSLVLGVVPPPPLGAEDGGEGDGVAQFIDWSRDHPALRLAGLDRVNVETPRKMTLRKDTPVSVLASDQYGPAIIEVADPAARAIVVSFDPAASDWPWSPGWLLFLADATRYLADAGESEIGENVRTGAQASTRLPEGAAAVRLTAPDGETTDLSPAPDGSVAFGPVLEAGVYRLSWQGPPGPRDQVVNGRAVREIAANLLDPAESDTQVRPTLTFASQQVAGKEATQVRLTRQVWPWLLLAALGVVLFEWFIYNRKVQV